MINLVVVRVLDFVDLDGDFPKQIWLAFPGRNFECEVGLENFLQITLTLGRLKLFSNIARCFYDFISDLDSVARLLLPCLLELT